MGPVVSILIPAHNAEAWIAETIKSALNQTWPRKEIIVVDDGSTDQTLAVARTFASREVRVVTQPNQGAAMTRNHAFSLSQGDWIQWLDADDLLSPDKVAKQMRSVEEFQCDRTLYSSGWGYFLYRTDRAKFTPTSLWCDLSPVEWLVRKMAENIFMQTGTWLVSRRLTEAAGAWDQRLLSDDDGEYFCRVLLASDGVRFVSGGRVFYRVVPATRLSYVGRSRRKQDAMLLSMQLHVKYLQSLEQSGRVRTACLNYLQIWLIYFFPERPDIVQELDKLAASVQGRLVPPELPKKYDWIKALFGWNTAKRAAFFLPELRAHWLGFWERSITRLGLPLKSLESSEKDEIADQETAHRS